MLQLLPLHPVVQLHPLIPDGDIKYVCVLHVYSLLYSQVIQELHGGRGHHLVQRDPKETKTRD